MEETVLSILRKSIIILPIIATVVFAGPQIEFDTKKFNCGTAIEGKTEKIQAIFAVKNTGDAVLKLEKVRPSCGCTVVKYDTLIQPGKTVKIESEVDIKGYRSGPLSKSITVTSNAVNEPTVRLTIEATVVAVIDVSENYLTLDKTNIDSPKTVVLATKKSDLKVTEISFKASNNSGAHEAKANQLLSIKHTWTPTDSVRADGYRLFKLNIFSPNQEESISGEFVIKTNHPDKATISLRGDISK
jgi:hypothetical protein